MEYLIGKGINESISLGSNGIKLLPDIFNNVLQ